MSSLHGGRIAIPQLERETSADLTTPVRPVSGKTNMPALTPGADYYRETGTACETAAARSRAGEGLC
jgi:hypothetical protein